MSDDRKVTRLRDKIAAVKKENDDLRAERKMQAVQIKALQEENDILRDQIEQMHTDKLESDDAIEKLFAELNELRDKYLSLNREIALAKKKYQSNMDELISRLKKQAG